MSTPVGRLLFDQAVQRHQAGRLSEAEALYRQILAGKPNDAKALHLLGVLACQVGRDDAGVDLIRQAIAKKPNWPDAIGNLAHALMEQGRPDEAIANYRQILTLDANAASAHLDMAHALLLRGDYDEGFAEYEWRWRVDDFPSARWNYTQPQWDGSSLDGKTILLHSEQGIGDTIQFIRYVPMVAERGGRIVVLCQPSLQRLMTSIAGIARCAETVQLLPTFDVHCPLLSLPHALATTPATIPASVPYLRTNPVLADGWRERLADDPGRLQAGLVWAGSSTHKNDRSRSLSLSLLAPLAAMPGVRFHSLQVGPAAEQASRPPTSMTLTDWTADLRDFADTAALIAHLDLVISVDTAVLHLAGAMGKPAWALLPFVPDWRWMLNRTDSPWYPTMRLFRQPTRGDWAGVIAQVADALQSVKCRRAPFAAG